MAVINKEIAYMALPLSIRRGNPFPVDEYSVWYDMGELTTYASTSPVAYVGQVVTLVNESENTVEAYVIQNAAGTLTKLAATTASGDLTADVQALQGKVSALETSVGTKGAESGIAATNVWNALEEIKAAYEAADVEINGKFAEYYNKSETDGKIAAAISSTYKAAGSVDFSALPELSVTEEGKVYNVNDAFSTTENFVEGTGKQYPAGTNVVCIETEPDTYKWDVLAGFVDLSAYETTSSANSKLSTKVNKEEGKSLVADTDISKLQGLANIKTVVDGELTVSGEGELSVVAIDPAKVTGLNTTLENKLNKNDALVTKLQGMANIKSVSSELTLGEDGALAINAIAQEKITGLPDALAGKVSGVKLKDTPLEVSEGVVTIPVATADALGVVKSNSVENGVTVDAEGAMTVHSLNANKLTQTPGEALILNGGTSAV